MRTVYDIIEDARIPKPPYHEDDLKVAALFYFISGAWKADPVAALMNPERINPLFIALYQEMANTLGYKDIFELNYTICSIATNPPEGKPLKEELRDYLQASMDFYEATFPDRERIGKDDDSASYAPTDAGIDALLTSLGFISAKEEVSKLRLFHEEFVGAIENARKLYGYYDCEVYAAQYSRTGAMVLGRTHEELRVNMEAVHGEPLEERVAHALTLLTLHGVDNMPTSATSGVPVDINHLARVLDLGQQTEAVQSTGIGDAGYFPKDHGAAYGAPVDESFTGSGMPANNPEAPTNPYEPIDPSAGKPQVNDIGDFMPRRETYGGGVKSE